NYPRPLPSRLVVRSVANLAPAREALGVGDVQRGFLYGKFGVRSWPVQQIEIEMISTEPGKARLTSTCHGVSSDVIFGHLGHYEGAVTVAGNRAVNQFFGTAF